MATVFSCKITDVHKKGITAIGYHSIRREIIVGFEGAILNTYKEHNGWINHIYHWKKQNLVFASGNDGLLVIIKNTGAVLKTGANSLHLNKISRLNIHTDIVKCLTYYNLRFISGGYDGTLIIFEQTLLGKNGLIVNIKIQRAHTAGISALLGFIDEDKNNWLVTGSFDKYVKLWSFEGNLIHKFDGFPTPITGICYSIATRIIWVTFSNNSVHLFDPISGQNISHCVEKYMPENQKHAYPILLLHYCNEKGLIIGIL
ncbi:hypothetical protein A3Q56_00263 [Intoshia linei]|uniref:Uncharacterized protein n=1 Tax=Intoshia linei TaxID=1819745 RepID=A0A177BEH4_9BILA|nr:hypothetical protein A3Q56_00263 [Intoshia linei]